MSNLQMQSFNNRDTRTNAEQADLTLREIADMLNLTKERVRQIEARALAKLRKNLNIENIKFSDLV